MIINIMFDTAFYLATCFGVLFIVMSFYKAKDEDATLRYYLLLSFSVLLIVQLGMSFKANNNAVLKPKVTREYASGLVEFEFEESEKTDADGRKIVVNVNKDKDYHLIVDNGANIDIINDKKKAQPKTDIFNIMIYSQKGYLVKKHEQVTKVQYEDNEIHWIDSDGKEQSKALNNLRVEIVEVEEEK